AEVVRYADSEVTIRVDIAQTGILVFSDLYTKDWQAEVDGQAARLYRANYAYRGVIVPAGNHSVRFRYDPLSYRVGKYISVSGVLLLLLCGIHAVVSSWRQKRCAVLK
ncbi:MAG: YfhO family protein, partial [Geobacteraceae bacterium]|nr:YfhO family protein [Geobacteraceae bacterium]